MRVIEFRFWTGHDFCGPYDLSDNSIEYFLQARYIVEQFTGSFDKNGLKIFEGDIVRFQPKYPNDHFLKRNPYGYLDSKIKMEIEEDYEFGVEHISFGLSFPASQCIIVGNIHQNPELSK